MKIGQPYTHYMCTLYSSKCHTDVLVVPTKHRPSFNLLCICAAHCNDLGSSLWRIYFPSYARVCVWVWVFVRFGKVDFPVRTCGIALHAFVSAHTTTLHCSCVAMKTLPTPTGNACTCDCLWWCVRESLEHVSLLVCGECAKLGVNWLGWKMRQPNGMFAHRVRRLKQSTLGTLLEMHFKLIRSSVPPRSLSSLCRAVNGRRQTVHTSLIMHVARNSRLRPRPDHWKFASITEHTLTHSHTRILCYSACGRNPRKAHTHTQSRT